MPVSGVAAGNESCILVFGGSNRSEVGLKRPEPVVEGMLSPGWLPERPECDWSSVRHDACALRRVALFVISHIARLCTLYLPAWYCEHHNANVDPTQIAGPFKSFSGVRMTQPQKLLGGFDAVMDASSRLLRASSTLRSFQLNTRPYAVFPSRDLISQLSTLLVQQCDQITTHCSTHGLLFTLALVRVAAANVHALASVKYRPASSAASDTPHHSATASAALPWQALLALPTFHVQEHVASFRNVLFRIVSVLEQRGSNSIVFAAGDDAVAALIVVRAGGPSPSSFACTVRLCHAHVCSHSSACRILTYAVLFICV
jgi:hypothetical protein